MRERRSEFERERAKTAKRQSQLRRYATSTRGKIVRARAAARHRLKAAVSEERRQSLQTLIALYDAELERMDRALSGGETRPYRERKIYA
ncbi:MAG: hypothetical protein P4L84_11310 [Isosphaeraceae bacterium]|nr:hypothetical protein [Isosphaeraceae bacterium]